MPTKAAWRGLRYIALQTTRPQSIAYGLTDLPVTYLTWIVEKVRNGPIPRKGAARKTRLSLDDCSTLAQARALSNRARRCRELPRRRDRTFGRVVGRGARPATRVRVLWPRHRPGRS